MSEENAVDTVKTTETAEQLQERLKKAEAKIVELKKSATPAKKEPKEETPTVAFDEETFEKKYEEKKFFESNPDMLEYKDKLTEYTAKGIGWKEAKVLVENSDETIANRKVASQTNFTSGEPAVNTPTYSRQDLEKMSQEEYNKVKDLQEQGKVTITN